MFEDRWNKEIVLLPHDRLIKAVIEPLIPHWLLPNHITVFRMLMIAPVVLLLWRENYAVGVPLFLSVALTDALDGSLARIRRQITEWGIVHDPIADKLLIGSVLFLIVLEHINFVLGVALIAVEAAMLVGGWYRKVHGRIEMAEGCGKLKMLTEVVAVLILLIALWSHVDLLVDISNGTLALALVFAMLSIWVRIK